MASPSDPPSGGPTPEQLLAALQALPAFPLPGLVFFPHSLLPLHVFEPRYRALVQDAVAGTGLLCVPMLQDGWQADYEGRPAVHPVAGFGRIVRHQALPDGRHNIILLGMGRVELEQELPAADRPYRRFRCRLRPDRPAPAGQLERLLAEIDAMSTGLVRAKPELALALARVVEGRPEPDRHLDLVAHLLLSDPHQRQAWVELDSLSERATLVQAALASTLAPIAEIDA
ncbi:LON peptidase substrate-binding domain-containing protein [Myxococcota bacterium]|nr:LON peptidase substrate-binding domain-containing protein [Myxococcota bacterium]